MNPLLALLPDLPDDLSVLSADELSALLDQARDIADRLTARDADTIGEATTAQVIEAATAAVAIIGQVDAQITANVAADEQAAADLAALREQAGVDGEGEAEAEGEAETTEEGEASTEEETTEEETEPVEGEATEGAEVGEEAEAIAAAAAAPLRARPKLKSGRPARPAARKPGDPVEVPVTVTASAEGTGLAIGEKITSVAQIRQAMETKMRSLRGGWHEGMEDQKIPLFRFHTQYPEERMLDRDDASGNERKINAVSGIEAVTAAGLCAPVTPTYELAMESIADRPLRSALPSFNATRGGVIFMAPPKLSAVTTAVGRVTNAQAIAGGTPAVKGCQVVACPAPTEVDVAAIYHCIRSENLNARAFPERLDQFTGLALAAQARLAENALLDAMVAASTAVTAGQAAGALSDLVKHVLTAAAGQRSRHRMGAEVPLHVVMPAWVVDLLMADTVRSQFDRFRARADVTALLREANVNITFHLDSPTTGTSQIYGAQGAGGLLDFPSTVQWLIYPEGSFTFLDGGELDLGIVRDSTLNTTNEFTVFGETWENVFFNGIESLAVTSTLCDTGQTGNTVAIACAS